MVFPARYSSHGVCAGSCVFQWWLQKCTRRHTCYRSRTHESDNLSRKLEVGLYTLPKDPGVRIVWHHSRSDLHVQHRQIRMWPRHLEKQAETFRICLGGLTDYCPESPKKSGRGFFQNGGKTESIFNVLMAFFKCRWRPNWWTYRLNLGTQMSVLHFSLT